MNLVKKTAVVTGGARGIGRAIALRLARDGANIGILDIQKNSAKKTAEEINTSGGRGMAVECDITDYEKVKNAVARVYQEYSSIDVLVNNAGLDKSQFFIDTDQPLWDRLIAVNYRGFLNATHVCMAYMIEQKSGNIISIGSDAGRVGNPGEVLYCGTKAALVGSSKALARELARFNIRVNCVCPGPVETELLKGLHKEEKAKKIMDAVEKLIPMRRIGRPEDVADVVAFFVSEDSKYLTGQVLSVDGGLTMIG